MISNPGAPVKQEPGPNKKLKPAVRRLGRWGLGIFLLLALAAGGARWLEPPPLALAFSTAVYDREGRLLRLTLASDQRFRLWTPLADISPFLRQAIVLHEDQWFYYHPGFNPLSLLRGAWRTYGQGFNPQGGSTITMQLARLRWSINTRSITGKLEQIARAMQLELFYSKDEILEAYLNRAPFGYNIEGIGAASLIYFNKTPAELTLPEAISLALLPQAPARRGKLGGGLNPDWLRDRRRLLSRWQEHYPLSQQEPALFDLPFNWRPPRELPFLAPHFSEQLLNRAEKGKQALISTLDLSLQKIVEERLKTFIESRKSLGIVNGAAILLDSRDMAVKALVGSAAFFDPDIQGQVNGSRAKRSPGSALKPFIYALALEQGLIHPRSMLKDVPTSFAGYRPENFDREFLGAIDATEALRASRNIPALYLARQLNSPNLYQFLLQAGVTGMKEEQHYGLSLALGGGEISMQEMAGLYAMLANRGMARELRWFRDEPASPPRRLLSAEASFLARAMLTRSHPPQVTPSAHPLQYPIAWKTGTSWNFRDAWCAGLWGPYVLVVWLGNFSGQGNPALTGEQAAAPLFFSILENIAGDYPDLPSWPDLPPPELKQVEVCAISGDLPGPWCREKTLTWFIPGISPIKVDSLHRPLLWDEEKGRAVCPAYLPPSAQARTGEFWPSDVAGLRARQGWSRLPLGCLVKGTSQPPRITSPVSYGIYTLPSQAEGLAPLALSAVSDGAVKRLYWFAGDAYIAAASPGQTVFWRPARPGLHHLRVADDQGRADSVMVRVESIMGKSLGRE
ncbi:MAG: penicillin-binding protein 1C [Desulfarculales bacterium]|jgi:penicillin-binding protein 1C|nr:penicillin-binding protein 1C [Desulfarculales bacterium]